MSEERHPTTQTWKFPEPNRGPLPGAIERTNLRELMARPGRLEHHLMVVGRIGDVQLEAVTASEPLFFAHRNISDEYALALPTGDEMLDAFPLRTFVSDFSTGEHLLRINHRVGHLLLHPYGFLHWPGQLRPPYAPISFPGGMRRTGLSFVVCAARPTVPKERPLFVSPGLEGAAKQYTDDKVPVMVAELYQEESRRVGVVDGTPLELIVAPGELRFERGGYVLILAGTAPCADLDLLFLPPGESLSGEGIERALVMASPNDIAQSPPASWRQVPEPVLAPFRENQRQPLPVAVGALSCELENDELVSFRIGDADPVEVPRYWLARMLFRIALHDYQIGYLETYGGFFYDDQGGYRFGLRGRGGVELSHDEMITAVARLYQGVAPAGYAEELR